ncbi:Cyclin-dependent kinase C-2 C [Salvia divinorum]|uniref:Cyclin-dependent kinase C-2 C n=1 Tax=Salvia divinorum TaxID=28513 RepID=A0ABD1G4E0_SALDI
MGCVSSKKIRCDSPTYDEVYSTSCIGGSRRKRSRHHPIPTEEVVVVKAEVEAEAEGGRETETESKRRNHKDALRESKREKKHVYQYGRQSEGDLIAAGWPSWLTAVAAEAIDGWVPLRADAYERLDKIGQGTYSNVYRARDLKTNKIVAVKKVRFDNFQAESVRFMSREIMILRMLDHPNVMKLEGIITSRLSCTIYLVFEYMEHDLAGLLSCPEITFTESQIKCYMRQLLSGLDHCHSRGIMHRDIKSSNILVNNQGVLKIADFGLAYFTRPKNREPLTSRVVTLWYRPPELLLGSTNYGGEVDLWSAGCVFAELFMGRPILKGRTEVEQLHKIFRLCGTPADEYWRASRLPLASMFKPQQPYDSTLRERCAELPDTAVDLIESLLGIQPAKRGTAASALQSEYFNTRPYACDPSNMPKFPPNKEMDAKAREDERRMKGLSARPEPAAVSRNPRRLRQTLHESSDFCKLAEDENEEENAGAGQRSNKGSSKKTTRSGMLAPRAASKQSLDTRSDISAASNTTQDSITSTKSVPVQRHKQLPVFTRLNNNSSVSKSLKSVHSNPILHQEYAFDQSATRTDSLLRIR